MSLNIVDKVKKLMGWCPNASMNIKKSQSCGDDFNIPMSDGDGSPSKRYIKSLFEWDYIVKEELLRSIAVFFYAFIGVGGLIMYGYIKTGITATPFLALIVTFVHFSIQVWYRKNVLSPAIHRFENSKPLRELIILITVYVIYLYFSIQYPVLQRAWILILLFIGLKLGKVFELNRPTGVKLMLFFATACAFVLIRYYVLQLPLMPLLKGITALGVAMLILAVLFKKAGFEEPDYLYRMDRRSFLIWVAIVAISVIVGIAVMIGLDKVLN
ncbi:DUF1673 family protein [Candidatus Methanoperedens nitratireducens]|uniref:DUF1673 family protein n=1 Tax=Candidatus Methanoperedens nitratireducens TaxID=1392998 RepID=UPI000694DA6D|nr:DUF1673 family protein [Candidatus Methanoperedens nitroreducens]